MHVYEKNILVLSLLAGAFTISSCTKEEHVQEYHIKSVCSGLVCRLSVEDDAIDRYINLLGNPKDKVIKRVLLNSAQDEITWSILGNGTFADNSQLEHRNLAPCTDDEDGCSLNSNPTGFVFESIGPEQIGVSGSIINDDGSNTQIDEQETVDVEAGKPIVSIAHVTDDELAYTFTADTLNKGLPATATFNTPTAKNTNVTFPVAGDHTVTMTATSPGNTVVQVTSENIVVVDWQETLDFVITDLPNSANAWDLNVDGWRSYYANNTLKIACPDVLFMTSDFPSSNDYLSW